MAFFSQINLLAVVAAAAAAFLAGAAWYGPLFGIRWMVASDMTPDRVARVHLGRLISATLALLVLAGALLAGWVGPDASAVRGALAGLAAGAWVGSLLGIIYLFEQRSLTHWLVNAGYLGAAAVLMGVVLAVWP